MCAQNRTVSTLPEIPALDGSLVRLERRSPNAYTDGAPNTSLLFYEKNAKTLSAVMGVLGVPPMQVDDDIQQTSASFITPNYFTELGTPAAIALLSASSGVSNECAARL